MPKSWGKGGKKGKGGHGVADSMATSCDLEAARMAAEMDPAYEAARMAAEMVLQTMAPMIPMTPGSLAAGGVRVAR